MRLKKYLPEFISEVKEFQELNKVCSVEIDTLRSKIELLQDNQFIESANAEGLRRYEQMLGLSSNNDLETRRFNILNKYNSTIPFTMMWLKNMLNTTLGKGNFLLDMNYKGYTLTIGIVASKEHFVSMIYDDLRKKIPCNLVLNVTTLEAIHMDYYVGMQIRTADEIKI